MDQSAVPLQTISITNAGCMKIRGFPPRFHAASAAFNNTSIPCDSTGLLKQ